MSTQTWGMSRERREQFYPYNVHNDGAVHRSIRGTNMTICGRNWSHWSKTDDLVTCRSCLKALRLSAPVEGWETHILDS